MINYWVSVLDKIPLTKEERKKIQPFIQNQQHVSFMDVSDIFYKHGFFNESIELLQEGAITHPWLISCKIKLMERLFERGYIEEAYSIYKHSYTVIEHNPKVHEIMLQICILIDDHEEALKSLDILKKDGGYTSKLEKLMDNFEFFGISSCQKLIQDQFFTKGIVLSQPFILQEKNPFIPKKQLEGLAHQNTIVYENERAISPLSKNRDSKIAANQLSNTPLKGPLDQYKASSMEELFHTPNLKRQGAQKADSFTTLPSKAQAAPLNIRGDIKKKLARIDRQIAVINTLKECWHIN